MEAPWWLPDVTNTWQSTRYIYSSWICSLVFWKTCISKDVFLSQSKTPFRGVITTKASKAAASHDFWEFKKFFKNEVNQDSNSFNDVSWNNHCMIFSTHKGKVDELNFLAGSSHSSSWRIFGSARYLFHFSSKSKRAEIWFSVENLFLINFYNKFVMKRTKLSS